MTDTVEAIEHQHLELKIKRASLAAESVIIKNYEGALRERILARLERSLAVDKLRDRRSSLHNHRMNVVRRESRAAHLASCFLRHVPYEAVESPEHTRTIPDWKRVKEIAKTFSSLGENALQSGLLEWSNVGDWPSRQAAASAARAGTRSARAEAHRRRRAEQPARQ